MHIVITWKKECLSSLGHSLIFDTKVKSRVSYENFDCGILLLKKKHVTSRVKSNQQGKRSRGLTHWNQKPALTEVEETDSKIEVIDNMCNSA